MKVSGGVQNPAKTLESYLELAVPDVVTRVSRITRTWGTTSPSKKSNSKLLIQESDEDAEAHFITLIQESVTALFPVVMERFHKWALYWR